MKRPSLTLEITAILAVKLMIIYGIWLACFSHPIDKELNANKMASHIFSNQSDNAISTMNTTMNGDAID